MGKKNHAKFSEESSVLADGLCIDCLGQWADVTRENSNNARIFLQDPALINSLISVLNTPNSAVSRSNHLSHQYSRLFHSLGTGITTKTRRGKTKMPTPRKTMKWRVTFWTSTRSGPSWTYSRTTSTLSSPSQRYLVCLALDQDYRPDCLH